MEQELLGECKCVYEIHAIEISPLFQCPSRNHYVFPDQPATTIRYLFLDCQRERCHQLLLALPLVLQPGYRPAIDAAWAPVESSVKLA
jgi:hypothetical protein